MDEDMLNKARRSVVISRARSLLSLLAVIGALWAWTVASPAAEKPAEGAAKEKDPLLEKKVYVPYEKLEAIFEKEGQGIFIPYSEFLEIWKAAQPKPPEPPPDEPPAPAVIRMGTYTGTVEGDVARWTVTFDVDALKKGWSELPLPFKGVAMESVEFSSPEVLFSSKGAEYAALFPAPGRYQANLRFSARVAQEPGKKTVAFGIPAAAVSRMELSIPEEDIRVDVQPMLAVTQTSTKDKATKVLAFLGNSTAVAVSWLPPAGKLVAEGAAILLAQQQIRVQLGETILKLATEITYQVLRGEIDTLRVRMPEGMRLHAVKGDNIREWAEEKEVLVVKLHSPLKDASRPSGGPPAEAASYKLSLSFERILPETPPTLAVPFPRAEETTREWGWAVFKHESDLNVRIQSTTGLTQQDREEVPEALRGDLGVGFRYFAHPLALSLQIEKITPRIRSFTTSVVSLGKEDDVWVGWIDYEITRAGVFRLEIKVPPRWSWDSVRDPSTAVDYPETIDAGGVRTIVLNLKSKALGAFRLPLRLTAPGSANPGEATIAPPIVAGSEQDRGLFGVSAPKAIDLSTGEREKMTPADVDELFRSGIMTQVGAEAGMPLTYSYREQPASVKVKLEAKKTKVDLLAQHLVEVSDGGVKLTHILDYEILYAAVERLTFTAPSALDGVLKVEAKQKKELRKGASDQGRTTWELILQAPALGAVSVTVTHEELKALEPGKPFTYVVPIIQSSDVQEKNGFVAIRKEGTLEIVPQPTGMEAIDVGDLPDKLRRGQIYSAFRYFTPDPTLNLTLTRYEYRELATTVVNLMRMKSVLSEERLLKSQVTLFVQNTERQYLELKLPAGAKLFSISVAGKSQQPRQRKEGGSTLVQIPPSAGPRGTFPIVIGYEEALAQTAMGSVGSVELKTLEILEGIPISKIELELYLPPEHVYFRWAGSLKPRFSEAPDMWSRFKKLLGGALGVETTQGRQVKGAPAPAETAAVVDVEIPTSGFLRHDFETLAPVGTLSFRHTGRVLFSFLDFIAFVGALGLGLYVRSRRRWSRSSMAVVFIFVPLALLWLGRGAILEICLSCLAGGALAFLCVIVKDTAAALKKSRARRLEMAPDPFLEEVVTAEGEPAATGMPAEPAKAPEPATPAAKEEPPASPQGPKESPERS
jgi:hypothetical protein